MFTWEEKMWKQTTSKTGRDSDRPPSQRDQRISNQFIESVVDKNGASWWIWLSKVDDLCECFNVCEISGIVKTYV